MRALAVAATAVLLAACGGGDEARSLEEWVAWEDGGQVADDKVPCVAERLRADLSEDQVDELTRMNLRSMSEDEMLEEPELLGAAADATFACETEDLAG